MFSRIDLEQAYVVVDVPADDLRRDAIAVVELDVQVTRGVDASVRVTRVRDHVGIR